MFDIGWSELLVVLVVALVVVGPKDLPRLMRVIGRWVGKARSMADQFRQSFDEIAREAELDDLRAEITALRNTNPLAEVEAELKRPVLPPDEQRPASEPSEAGAPPQADAGEATEAKAPGGDSDVPEAPESPVPPGSEPPAP